MCNLKENFTLLGSVPSENKDAPSRSNSLDIPNVGGSADMDPGAGSSSYQQLGEGNAGTTSSVISSSWEMNYHEAAIFLEVSFL